MSAAPLQVEPLRLEHLAELAAVLRHPAVYEHIGGEVPSVETFVLGLTRALAGPRSGRPDERWFQFLMREPSSGRMIGRLEATVVGRVAEVAFLLDPAVWGRGHAQAGLAWLHAHLAAQCGPVGYWATTLPANLRCQALLRRAGYVEVPYDGNPALQSHDPGDIVFRRSEGC